MYLANYPSHRSPTDSADEPKISTRAARLAPSRRSAGVGRLRPITELQRPRLRVGCAALCEDAHSCALRTSTGRQSIPGVGSNPVFRGPSPSAQGVVRNFVRRIAEGSYIPTAAARPVDAAGGPPGGSVPWIATASSATSKSPASGCAFADGVGPRPAGGHGVAEGTGSGVAPAPPGILRRSRAPVRRLSPAAAAERFSMLVAPCRWQARKQSFTVSWCLRRSVPTRRQASRD